MKGWPLFIFLLFVVAPAFAYKPGTVGYLYESCRDALRSSENIESFDVTYCGGFIEGYTVGVASNVPLLPPPAESDPCYKEKKNEYDKINDRFCANLPNYANVSLADAHSVAPKAADIFFRWIDFLKKENSGKDALKLPVAAQLNAMIGEGNFCDALGAKDARKALAMEISPALMKVNLVEYVDMQWRKTLGQKYGSCAADLAHSDKKTNPFRGTRCGAEITGFITGILSARRLQESRPSGGGACEKQISRLYRDIDPTETMCVTEDTNPAAAAKIFLTRVDELRAAPGGEKTDSLPGYGAAGRQAIYYGLLCRK